MEPLPHMRSFGWQSGALLHPRNNKERRVGHEAPAFQVRGFIFDDHELSKMAPLYGNLDRGRSSITFWA